MTIRNKGPKTLRTSGNLGRRLPNKDGVAMLVTNGVAVSGGVQLNTVYRLVSLTDLVALKIDAAYDTTNRVLVYKHLFDIFNYNPNAEVYLFIAPQKVSSTEITPDVLCDKANAYVKKAIDDAKTNFTASIKLLGVAYNPSSTYTPTITAGIDSTGALAKAKLKALLQDYEDNYSFVSAVLEARSFSGTYSALQNVEVLSSSLAAPRIRFVIAADLATTAKDTLYNGYAAVGAELGMMSKAAVSENYGNPVDKFNLTDTANGLFLKPGLSGNNALSTDNAVVNDIENKGYIFCEAIEGVNGIYFNDTRTCVLASDDYAYCENNRTIDKVLLLVRHASLPLTTNARLQVDTTSGEITLANRTLIEGACEEAIRPMIIDGDISGGITCVIPAGINVLAGDELYINVSFVPVAIGRKITIKAGMNNPF